MDWLPNNLPNLIFSIFLFLIVFRIEEVLGKVIQGFFLRRQILIRGYQSFFRGILYFMELFLR